MSTECYQTELEFQGIDGRRVVADFDGGEVTSDGGGLLVREADLARRVCERFARCFEDERDLTRTQHSLVSLIRQRVFGLVLGYEDVNDHETLRDDWLFHLLADQGELDSPLAGKSTLNRLEVSASASRRDRRYHKISFSPKRYHRLLRELFFEAQSKIPCEVVLDLDATDFTLHGKQECRFFHGYYRSYCYLPLYIFCGDDLLHSELRPSNIDQPLGSVEALEPIVREIRRRWPRCRIIIRGDSGFGRPELMDWCENNGVRYILGLQINERLRAKCTRRREQARRRMLRTGNTVRLYASFGYRTLKTWTRKRRVVAKCECSPRGENPRFVVTNLSANEISNQDLYDHGYCPRGDMENRIKEQLDMFADRSSCETFDSNQLRMALSGIAYALMTQIRQTLKGTEMERAQPDTIRLRLFKIGARVKQSVRRIVFHFSSSYPWKALFIQCYQALKTHPPPA